MKIFYHPECYWSEKAALKRMTLCSLQRWTHRSVAAQWEVSQTQMNRRRSILAARTRRAHRVAPPTSCRRRCSIKCDATGASKWIPGAVAPAIVRDAAAASARQSMLFCCFFQITAAAATETVTINSKWTKTAPRGLRKWPQAGSETADPVCGSATARRDILPWLWFPSYYLISQVCFYRTGQRYDAEEFECGEQLIERCYSLVLLQGR